MIFSLPFDEHSYLSFLFLNIYQVIYASVYFLILAMVSAYFLGVCFYLEAICDDFGRIFEDLNDWSTQDASKVIRQIAKPKLTKATTLQIYAFE